MHTKIKSFCPGLPVLIAGFMLFLAAQATAQPPFNKRPEFLHANSRWILDANMGLDFNSGNPGTISNTSGQRSKITVSDPVTGDLLFYSDGLSCYNSNHQLMQNGGGIIGHDDPVIDQSLVVTPVIGQTGKYYLFSVFNTWGTNSTIYYSVIDMSLDNGLGGVVAGQKNITIATGNYANFMIAVPGNNCDIWLVTHKQIEPEFKTFHITAGGIDVNAVSSLTGSQIQGLSPNPGFANHAYVGGTMTIAPDRSKLALCSYSITVGGMLLCRFDPDNGIVSGAIKLVTAEESGIQAAFSPDNSKLYMVTNAYNTVSFNHLLQWHINTFDSAAIAATRTIAASNNNYTHLSANRVRLRGDTIYMAHHCYGNNAICSGANKKVSIISAPNSSGAACNYQPGVITLSSATAYYNTLQPDVVFPLPPDTVFTRHDTVVCTTGNMFPAVTLQVAAGGTGYLWDDGSTASSRNITQAGTYRVSTTWGFCDYQVDSFIVRQRDVVCSLGDDVAALCGNNTYELKLPALPGASYRWQDGSSSNTFTVSVPGTYRVELTDSFGCKASDSITVTAKELIGDLGDDILLCKGDPVDFTFRVNSFPNTETHWSTGSRELSINVREPGIYWVSVKDPLCMDSDTIRITEEVCSCALLVPNAFSPNRDGINDYFLPAIEDNCPISGFTFSIYNRYGQRIFSSSRPGTGWDGNYNGLPADAGNYFYELRFKGGTKPHDFYRKGDLVLIR